MVKITNLYSLIMQLNMNIDYLKKHDIQFTENGFPIFKKEWFISKYPELIVPYNHRNDKKVLSKDKTILCMFASDSINYNRISKIYNEINIYKDYMGAISFDTTITSDMGKEWQDLIMLLNLTSTCILAVNGIKIALNTRTGYDYINSFEGTPKGIVVASSFLGCSNSKDVIDCQDYLNKVLYLLPKKMLLYGKRDLIVEEQLNNIGISYKVYKDFHRLSKEVYNYGQ